VIEGPDDATDAELIAIAREQEAQDAQPSWSNTARQALGQGLALSFGDEIEAGVRSVLGADYDATLSDIRAQNSAYQEANPVRSFAEGVVGGFALPGLGTAGTVARTGATLANTARQGAIQGAGFGAVAGFGAGEDSVGDRLRSGATGGAAGALGGAVATPAIRAAGDVFGGAARLATNRRGASIDQVAKAAADDGIDPAGLRQTIAPTRRGARALSREQVDGLVRAFSDGTTAAQAARDLGIAPGTVRSYYQTFRQNTRVPRSIVDLASNEGPAKNLKGKVRAAAALPGQGQDTAFRNIGERQLSQQARLMTATQNAVARRAGNPTGRASTEARVARGREAVSEAARPRYDALAATPPFTPSGARYRRLQELRDEPEFAQTERFARRMINRDRRRNGVAPLNANELDFNVINLTQTLLRESSEVLPTAPAAERQTTRLYREMRNDLLDVTEDLYPGFDELRAEYRQAQGYLEALKQGRATGISNSRPARENMVQYEGFDDLQRQGFDVGVGDAVIDDIGKVTPGNDATRALSRANTMDRVRQTLGNDLAGVMEQEAAVARNAREMLQGSRTAVLGEELADLSEPAQAAAAAFSGNPIRGLEAIGARITRVLREGNAQELADILTTTDQPRMLQILDEL
ncbi:MAG: hypothetical protein AAGG72_09745, partial [Pseudomonadota bacterium]